MVSSDPNFHNDSSHGHLSAPHCLWVYDKESNRYSDGGSPHFFRRTVSGRVFSNSLADIFISCLGGGICVYTYCK